MAEKRVDPDDGKAYTFDELSTFYKGKYSKKEVTSYWEELKPAKGKGKGAAKAKAKSAPKGGPKEDAAAKNLPVKTRMKAGDPIPTVELDTGFPPNTPDKKCDLAAFCKDKKVVLVGMPGAFGPTSTETQVPGYLAKQDELKAKGVTDVIMFCVNDAAVMGAWAAEFSLAGSIVKFMSDTSGSLTKALGMVLNDKKPLAMLGNLRCKRFSMLIESGVIKSINVAASKEDPAGDTKPDVANVEKILEDCDKVAAKKGLKPPLTKVGDTIPDVELDKGYPPEKVKILELSKGKKIIITGMPGAYTPT
jgi:peroxiredoxin